MISSVLHLVCLSTDRIIYVMYALKYKKLVQRHRVLFVIGLLWAVCFLLGGIQLLWTLQNAPWKKNQNDFRLYHVAVLFVCIIFIPSIILFLQSVAMVRIIYKLDAVHRNEPNQTATRKAFVLYAVMYLLFVLFSYPHFIITFVYILKGDFFIPIEIINMILFIRFLPCFLFVQSMFVHIA